ncbi:MAG: hypothetical protein KKB50_16435 [Planctomycetes bacterium]|nr:hypothetical protein [Planctomycetota bacterium]
MLESRYSKRDENGRCGEEPQALFWRNAGRGEHGLPDVVWIALQRCHRLRRRLPPSAADGGDRGTSAQRHRSWLCPLLERLAPARRGGARRSSSRRLCYRRLASEQWTWVKLETRETHLMLRRSGRRGTSWAGRSRKAAWHG